MPLEKGVPALVDVIEREPARGYVPEWPWRPVAGLLRVLPAVGGPPLHLRRPAAVRIVVAS